MSSTQENVNHVTADPKPFDVAPMDSDSLQPQDPVSLTPLERKNPAFHKSDLTVAALLLAGLFGVYLMHFRGGPEKVSAEQLQMETQVDDALAKLTAMDIAASKQSEQSSIVDVFYYEAKHRQIPMDKIAGNPFIFRGGAGLLNQNATGYKTGNRSDSREIRQLSDAMAAVAGLKLQSVLMSVSGATAVINNNLLTQGQRIDGWVVEEIKPNQVTLRWNDQTYLLKMR